MWRMLHAAAVARLWCLQSYSYTMFTITIRPTGSLFLASPLVKQTSNWYGLRNYCIVELKGIPRQGHFRNRSALSEDMYTNDPLHFSMSTVPPAPMNLRNITQSIEAVNFTWDPGHAKCSNANYYVSTNDCGNCSQTINTTNTNILCEGLKLGQQCNISVWSSLECGVLSNPVEHTYEGMFSMITI